MESELMRVGWAVLPFVFIALMWVWSSRRGKLLRILESILEERCVLVVQGRTDRDILNIVHNTLDVLMLRDAITVTQATLLLEWYNRAVSEEVKAPEA